MDKKRLKILLTLMVVILFGLIRIFQQQGLVGVKTVFTGTVEMLFSMSLILIFAFIFAGQVEVILTNEVVNNLFIKKRSSKLNNYFLASFLGGLIPLGPFYYFPFTASLYEKGVPSSTIVTFIAAKRLWNYKRLAIESAFLPPWLVITRFIITLPVPILSGLLSNLFFEDISLIEKEGVKR